MYRTGIALRENAQRHYKKKKKKIKVAVKTEAGSVCVNSRFISAGPGPVDTDR